jgi:hypothetical protein
MKRKKISKYIHEGKYMAEVKVELIFQDNEWSPYLTFEDARKMDDVREALKRGDLQMAAENAMIYELHPLTIGSGVAQPTASTDLCASCC